MSEVDDDPFLTARWDHLVLLNYTVPSSLLQPLVPRGTLLDDWGGDTLISLVGFRFWDTRVRGRAIPGHRDFEEVNLRFYVRRIGPYGDLRRAVVFIRELVRLRLVAAVARRLYNEPYLRVPMSHAIAFDAAGRGAIRYDWQFDGRPFAIEATVAGEPAPMPEGSEAEYVAEHYWAYTDQQHGNTLEYQVDHPRWRIWPEARAHFRGPASLVYGPMFGEVLAGRPRSVMVAEGSRVRVFAGHLLE